MDLLPDATDSATRTLMLRGPLHNRGAVTFVWPTAWPVICYASRMRWRRVRELLTWGFLVVFVAIAAWALVGLALAHA
jgi:hypothetical protein